MLSDTNDDFCTPPSSPHLFSLTSPLSSPDLSPSQHDNGMTDLSAADLDNSTFDHESSATITSVSAKSSHTPSSTVPSISTNYPLSSTSMGLATSRNHPHFLPSVVPSGSTNSPPVFSPMTANDPHLFSSATPSTSLNHPHLPSSTGATTAANHPQICSPFVLPTSANRSYIPSSTAPSVLTTLPLMQYLSELITNGLDHTNIDQLVERLQLLEKIKIDLDELYYKLQDHIFDAIGKCEQVPGNRIQNQLLDGMKRWKETTTKSDAIHRKLRMGEKLEKLQKLIMDNQRPKRKRPNRIRAPRKSPPKLKYLDYVNNAQQQNETSDNHHKDTDALIRGLDSEQLTEAIQQKLCQGYITVEDQRQIEQLRRQLANQRKGDLENTLKTTSDHAERERISALLRQGELYQELQKLMALAEEHELVANPPKLLPSLTKQENGNKQLGTQQETSTGPQSVSMKYDDTDKNMDYNDTKQHSSSPSISTSSSTLETPSPIQDTSPSTQTISPSALKAASRLGTSSSSRESSSIKQDIPAPSLNISSPKEGTTFLQKSICPLELEGGVCLDSGCQLAHFRDYYSSNCDL